MSTDAQLQQVVFWTLGSLSRASWSSVLLLAVVLAVALPILVRLSPTLTAFRLGDARARALGVPVDLLRVLPQRAARASCSVPVNEPSLASMLHSTYYVPCSIEAW